MTRSFFIGAPGLNMQLAAEDYARLVEAAAFESHAAGALIHPGGTVRPSLDIVQEGAVRIGNPHPAGERVLTAVCGPGHCFGEQSLYELPRVFDAHAQGDTVLAVVPAETFHRLAEQYPTIGRAVATVMARRFHALLGFLDDLKRLPLNVTIAKLLITQSLNREHEPGLGCNTDELAAMLGLSPVALGPVLSRFERDGLVRRLHGRVELRDRARLEKWVEQRVPRTPLAY